MLHVNRNRFCVPLLAGFAVVWIAGQAPAGEPMSLNGAIVTLIEQADVPARAVGPIADILVHEGDVVTKGQPLAKVDDTEAALSLARVELELAVARREAANDLPVLAATKAAEAARAELKRAVESGAKYQKSISESELDRLRLAADEAEYKRRQAIHVRETAELTARVKENESQTIRHQLQLHQFAAPIAGVVVEIKRRRGEWVEPGMPVVRIMLTDRLRVEAFCTVAELSAIVVGRPMQLQVAHQGGKPSVYDGRITFVSPEVNPVNGQVRIWAEVKNDDRALRPGMNGTFLLAPVEKSTAASAELKRK